MTILEKKQLFTKLYLEWAKLHGHGWKTRFANSLKVTNRTVLNWLDPAQGWTSAEQEADIWRYFGWTLNPRGDPVPGHQKQDRHTQGLLDFDELLANLDSLQEQLNQQLDALRSEIARGKESA